MVVYLDDGMIARLEEFSDKHCGGKEPDLELMQDMARALGLRLGVELTDD